LLIVRVTQIDLKNMEGSMSNPPATTAVDLSDGDSVLSVDISDALSERDWVKFTVHTKTSLQKFVRTEFSVIRLHEEFIWLHDTFAENPDYAGFIIPPPPPRPDFDASREKLRKLGDAEGKDYPFLFLYRLERT
jgi:sorting nexin-5/6/32